MMEMNYQDINAKTIDRWIEEGWEWGRPISHEQYTDAKNGKWEIKLTPAKNVPHEWIGDLKGKKILGLASGGGQQMPVFAALGAECTVLDYSQRQIDTERMVAEREGYSIRIIQGDMTKPLPFADGEFDLIFHPVSNCYVEDVCSIWKECYRILKYGGFLISGTDHYINYIVDNNEKEIINSLPFNPLKDPQQMRQLQEDDAGVQFSHSLEEQIGGQLAAGFTLLDMYEDTNGEGRLHELNIPTFLAMRSIKGTRDVLNTIADRHSYRGRYKQERVPREDLCTIMKSGLAAPSGCNKQTTSLIAVDDPELLQKLYKVIIPPVCDTAPAMICVLTQRITAYRDRCFAVQDYSAAIENMLLAITAMGYQSCWYEGHITDEDRIGFQMAKILNIPDEYELVCMLPVGLPETEVKAPKKKSFEERAWFNFFSNVQKADS